MQWNIEYDPPAQEEPPAFNKENLSEEDFKAAGLAPGTPSFNFDNDPDMSLYEPTPDRRPLEELDANTQDSGYGCDRFCEFARSLGVMPQPSYKGKRTFGSMESVDEEFMEFTVEEVDLPSDFGALISGRLAHPANSPDSRPVLRRSMSECVQMTPNRMRACKKAKAEAESTLLFRNENSADGSPMRIQRSMSVTEESIKYALHRSSTEPDLIGDFSRTYSLPLTAGQHQDLKSITPHTLAEVIRGHFNEALDSYKIIDCRFPYEFDGGHVNGAVNLYTKDQIIELLNEQGSKASRNVLVFHCEFSSERGPTLCRFLRNLDRVANKDVYPTLRYPELYLLEGGYKSFYEQFEELCEPRSYKPMLHPEHQKDMRFFRQKSKSSSENRFHPPNHKGNFKRLGFL